MDPATAFARVLTALLEFLTELVKGQTAEQKAAIWDHYLDHVARLRRIFHLDREEPDA